MSQDLKEIYEKALEEALLEVKEISIPEIPPIPLGEIIQAHITKAVPMIAKPLMRVIFELDRRVRILEEKLP